MNAFIFCLGFAYIAVAVLELSEPPAHRGLSGLMERGKEALTMLIGLLYIEHSGLVALALGTVAVSH